MEHPRRLGQDATPPESLLEEIRVAVLDPASRSKLDEESILLEVQFRQHEQVLPDLRFGSGRQLRYPAPLLDRTALHEAPGLQIAPPRLQFVADRIKGTDRKSTRLNSSHPSISYAVFCLKK